MQEQSLTIEGMTCEHCVSAVSNLIKEIEGVKTVNVSLQNKNATLTTSDNLKLESIINQINDSGIYKAH